MSAGYFGTLGIRVARGREFGRFDAPGRPLVAVVNDAFVARHLPGENPLGQRISVFGAAREIVGVVPNERFSRASEAGPAPAMYLPLAQNPMTALTIVVRTTRNPLDQVPGLREALRGVDPTLALFELASAEQALVRSMEGATLHAAAAGGLRRGRARAGRRRDLRRGGVRGVRENPGDGCRIALGAEPRHVFRMVVPARAWACRRPPSSPGRCWRCCSGG